MTFQQSDIIMVSFSPTHGHEQQGKRPALVLQRTDVSVIMKSCIIVLPITTSTHVFPFDVALDNRTQTKGHILSRRIRALDLDNRMAYKIERAPDDIVNQRIRNIELMIEKE